MERYSGIHPQSLILIAFLCLMLCSSVHAYDSGDLMQGFEAQQALQAGEAPNFYALGLYQGYIWSAADALAADLCAPEDITRGEVLLAVHEQIGVAQSSDDVPSSAAEWVTRALRAAFPCG